MINDEKSKNQTHLSNAKKLGSHGYCEFFKLFDLITKKNIFLKKYSQADYSLAYREIFINERLMKLNHSNIVKYYGSSENDNSIFVNFEYCEQGSLYDLLKINQDNKNRFNFSMIIRLIYQIIKGLIQIHKNGIIHNDIKLENILLFKSNKEDSVLNLNLNLNLTAKISDFNNSLLYNGEEIQNLFADEFEYEFIFNNESYQYNQPSFQYDYWCLGVMIYQLIFCKMPLGLRNIDINQYNRFKNNKILVDEIISESEKSSLNLNKNRIPYKLKCFLKRLLVCDDSINDQTILYHPVFNKCSVNSFDLNKYNYGEDKEVFTNKKRYRCIKV